MLKVKYWTEVLWANSDKSKEGYKPKYQTPTFRQNHGREQNPFFLMTGTNIYEINKIARQI